LPYGNQGSNELVNLDSFPQQHGEAPRQKQIRPFLCVLGG